MEVEEGKAAASAAIPMKIPAVMARSCGLPSGTLEDEKPRQASVDGEVPEPIERHRRVGDEVGKPCWIPLKDVEGLGFGVVEKPCNACRTTLGETTAIASWNNNQPA
jgi:hypothetical protein